MIKLIISDMDGSLLHTDKTMPKGFFELIQKLKQQGILFAAGSGRQLASLQNSFQPVQKDMYFIAENGCITIDGSTQNVLDVHCLDKGYVKKFIEICRNIPDTYVVVCGRKSAYYEFKNEKILLQHVTPYYFHHQQVEDIKKVEDDILKLAVLNLQGTASHVYPNFETYLNNFNISVSAFEWMDIMAKDIHKGLGVQTLCKYLGIQKHEVMIFGDFMNDYEMLQEAYFSFAMKNALPEIKEICNFETTFTNDEDGVKYEIEYWLSNNQEKLREYMENNEAFF